MCSEFLLAIIYFSIILFVNFFLFKLLNLYFKNILVLLKLKNTFTLFNKSQNNFVSILYIFSKKEMKNMNLLLNLNTFSKTKDLLLIGNTFDYLAQNSQIETNLYYFKLLKNQFLLS